MLSKAATTLSFLFAVLLLLSLPGAGSEGNLANYKRVETNTGVSLSPPPDSKTPAAAGFSYSRWLASGQPAAHENRTSGTFILKTAVGDIYRSRLTAAWRDVGARALNIEPLLRDELLLLANNKDSHWQSAWKNHREALLPALVDGTSDALLGGVLESGRALSWVRHLEVDFRTKLGKRPGSFGVNAILALHERADDATGLQLRGFFGNKFKGANAGVFYRRALGDNLLGGNVFLDYENADVDGDFWRWSLGAEWRSPYVELYGNRYLGITGGKRQLVGGQYIYTADGTEVELALKNPYASWLSGVLGYYRWDGEYGDKVDKGFRYGIRADRRLGGFSFELQYEDPEVGKGSWGGRVSYSHDFAKGAESASSTQALTFDPRAHFFDAVRREYTQRIRKTAGNVFTGRIRISYLNGWATIVGSELTLQIHGSSVTFTTELALIGPTVNAGVTTIVTGTVRTQTISPPNDYFITATALLTAFTRSPSTLRISVNNWEIELHSELVFAFDSPTLLLKDGELMVTRNDGGISVVALANGRPTLNLENALIMVSITTGGAVSLQLTAGLVSLMLNANNTLNASVINGTLIVSLVDGSSIDAELESAGNGLIVLLRTVNAVIVTTSLSPLAGRLVNASAVVATGYTSLVAQVTATGIGSLSYTLVAGGDTFAVGETNGSLSLTVAKSSAVTLTAMVRISDTGTLGVRASPPVTVGYTLRVAEKLRFSSAQVVATITTYDNNRALLTASAAGALGTVIYTRISTNPASLAANFRVLSGGVVSVQQAFSDPTMLSLVIQAAEETINGVERLATLSLAVAVVDPPTIVASLVPSNPVVITGYSGSVAQVNSSGGDGDYVYGLPNGLSNNALFRIGTTDGELSLATAQSAPITLTAAVTVNDGHRNTPAVTLNLTVEIVDALVFTQNRVVDITLTTHGTVPVALHTAVATNPGSGAITYSLISTFPPGFSATINFTQLSEGGVVSLTATLSAPINASIYIRATTSGDKATLTLALAAVDPPAFSATLVQSNPMIFTGYSGSVAQVNSSGGRGDYTYAFQPADGTLTVNTVGLITLLAAVTTPTTLTAILVADDHPNTPAVTLSLTLAVLAKPALENIFERVIFSYTGSVASVVNAPSGGKLSLVAGGNHFTVGTEDGLLNLTAVIDVSSTLTASIAVDVPLLSPITLGYILTVGPCSFFSGCQPSVSYDGRNFGWQTNLSLARALINASADIDEIHSETNQTPLLYVANSGSPQVASVLLTAGANVNAVHRSYTSQSRTTISNKGVLYYLADNGRNDVGQLLSLFVEGGANINLVLTEEVDANNSKDLTPFDLYSGAAEFNFGKKTLLLPSTKSFGGKCLQSCMTVNGVRDITLAPVSFSPPSLTVTAAAAAAGDLYTVRAASGLGTLFNYQVVSTFPANLLSSVDLLYVDVNSARLSLKSAPGQDFSVYIEVTDVTLTNQPSGEKATLKYAFRESFSFNPSRIATTEVLDSYFGFAIYRGIRNPSGAVKGLAGGSVTYSLLSTDPLNAPVSLHPHNYATEDDRHVLHWTEDPAVQTLSIFIKAADTAGNAATLTLSVAMVAPPALVVSLSGGMRNAIIASIGPVAAVITSGGGGNGGTGGGTTRFSVVFGAVNFTVGAGGTISLKAVHNMPTVLTASIVVDNAYNFVDLVPLVTVGYTLSLVAKPALASIFFERVIFSYTGPVASITNVSSGGLTFVEGADNFRVGTDGLLSLTASITVASMLKVSIVADVFPPLTLGYTLNVGACSFLDGCQPSVNFNGDYTDDPSWLTDTSQLRSLIAAGADVSEVRSAPVDNVVINGNTIMTTSISRPPLYLMIRRGTAAGASIMLNADSADVNVLVRGFDDGKWDVDRGVFYYLTRRVVTNADVEDTRQLIERVISVGVNINQVRVRFVSSTDTQRRTPLDHFSSEGSFRQFIYLIHLAGGKCSYSCSIDRGDVRLASVSFRRPAAVTVTAAATFTGDLYTVRAATGLGTLFNYRISVFPAALLSNFSLLSVDVHNSRLSLKTALDFGQTVSIYIEATDRPSDAKATLRYDLIIPSAPAFVNASAYVLTAYTGAVASIANVPPGGALSVVDGGNNFTVGTDGVLSLTATISGLLSPRATVVVYDGSSTPIITLTRTFLVIPLLSFSPVTVAATITTYDNNRALFTALATGVAFGATYAQVSTNPANLTANFTVSSNSGVVSVQQEFQNPTTLSLFIRAAEDIGGEQLATLLLTVAVVDPPTFMASLVPSNPVVVVTGYRGSVAQVNSSGGKGTTTYTIQPVGGNLTVGTAGRIDLRSAVATPATLTATLVANNDHLNTTPVTLNLTVEIADVLGFALVDDITVTTYGTVPVALHTAVATNPNGGTITYSLLRTDPPSFDATINFTQSIDGGVVSLIATLLAPTSASIYIRASTDTELAILTLALTAVDPPAFVATLNNDSPVVITGYKGLVAQVNSSGGARDYTYAIQPADGVFAVNTAGLITLLTAQAAPAILIATLVASDSHPDTPTVTLNLTLSLVAKPALANIFERVVFSYTGSVAFITNVLSGSKLSVVFGGGNFTVGRTDRLLSLTATITVESTLTANIVVDLFPPLTLGYTLTVGPCSFFGGCRPSVNYDGAKNGALDNTGRTMWAAINASLARALIAASVDVNEVALEMTNNSISSRDTPLLAAARYSSPSVVSILLTAGASPDSLGIVRASDSDTYSDIGVFDYVVRNTAIVDNIPNIPLLVSLFVANSVDVNQRTKRNNVEGITPLDRYNSRSTVSVVSVVFASAALIINAAGGKCLSTCLTVNGVRDITLAAVSFAPPSLTVVAAAGALYPVRAASGLGTLFNYQVVSTFPASLTSSVDLLTVDVNSARLSLKSAPEQDFSVYIEVTDVTLTGQPSGEKATLKYTFRESFSFNPSRIAITEVLDSYFGFAIYRGILDNSGAVKGLAVGSVTYSLLSTDPLNAPVSLHPHNYATEAQRHNLYWTEDPAVQTLSIFIQAADEDPDGNAATLTLSVAMVAPPALVVRLSGGMRNALTAYTGPVAAVITSGGGGNNSGNGGTTRFSVVFGAVNFTVGAGGTISLTAVHNMTTVLTASIVVDNDYLYVDLVPLVTVGYTLSLVVPAFANIFKRVAFPYTGPVASVTNVLPASGFTVIYGEDNFTVGTDGLLNLTATITVVSTLTASIAIDLFFPPLMVGYTLTVEACLFSKGCQPTVNFDGSQNYRDGGGPWQTNLALAQSLIAVGVDIEEILINDASTSKRTPLLIVADNGTRAVAELFLDNGANLHAVGSETHQGSGAKYSNFGVLSYMNDRGGIIESDTLPLISLFVARGADVNRTITVVRDGATKTFTPLDLYRGSGSGGSFGRDATAASLIKPFGAKCLLCLTVNGVPVDIRLASVSFAPASSLTATAAVTFTGNLYTVQAASGLGTRFSYEVGSASPASSTSNFSVLSVDVNSAILRLDSALEAGVYSVFVEATDQPSGDKATVRYVHVSRPYLANASLLVAPTYDGAVASVTGAPSGTRALVAGGNHFTLRADGVLSLKAAIGFVAILTASIEIYESPLPTITLGYTLNVGSCSFYFDDGVGGCGAFSSYSGHNSLPWQTDPSLIQEIIDAGADIDEIHALNNRTPLFYVAANGTPQAVELLLDNGADLHAVHPFTVFAGPEYANLGVFYYLGISFHGSVAIAQRLSIFAERGANVNLRVREEYNGIVTYLTPLDFYRGISSGRRGNNTSLIPFIKSFGGKCLGNCRSGDITLASVSFAPASVTVSAAATFTGNLYTVQAASGLGTRFSYQMEPPVSNFSLLSVDVNRAILRVNSALGVDTYSVTIKATDNNPKTDNNLGNNTATLKVQVNITEP